MIPGTLKPSSHPSADDRRTLVRAPRISRACIAFLVTVFGVSGCVLPSHPNSVDVGSGGGSPTGTPPPRILTQAAVQPQDAEAKATSERRREVRSATLEAQHVRTLAVATRIAAADNPYSTVIGGTGGLLGGLAVAGDRAYTGLGDELLVLGTESDGSIEIRARAGGLIGLPLHVAVVNQHAYVVSLETPNVAMLPVREPNNRLAQFELFESEPPRFVGHVLESLSHDVRAMAAGDGWLAMSTGDRIVMVDARDPANVHIAGELPDVGYAKSIEWSGDHLYVTSRGVQAIDVRNPAEPIVAGSVLEDKGAIALALSGEYAFAVSCWSESGMWVIDLTEPLAPAVVESAAEGVELEDCEGAELVADGDRLWLASDGVVQVFDVSDPLNPTEITRGEALLSEEGNHAAMFSGRLLAIERIRHGSE